MEGKTVKTTSDHHREGNDPYFVVGGTEELFETIAHTQVEKARQAIFDQLATALPNHPINWVTTAEVKAVLTRLVAEARVRFPESPTVSLSRVYYDTADCYLECNRLTDPEGNPLGVGPRPGSASLATQTAILKQRFPSKKLIVVDDMLFHGESLEKLMAAGLDLAAIVTAFAVQQGTKKAEELGIQWYVETVVAKLLDMIPLHDWLPPLPLCGKVVGYKPDGPLPQPMFEHGLSLCLPYLVPFITPEKVTEWASIPTDHAVEFSAVCLKQSLEICQVLETRRVLTKMSDLANMEPRASHPVLGKVDPEKRIVVFLREALAQLDN